VLVHCWSHLRRRFVKLVRNTKSPIAEAAVRQTATLYSVEATVRGASPQVRLAARQEHSAPIITALNNTRPTSLDRRLNPLSPSVRPLRTSSKPTMDRTRRVAFHSFAGAGFYKMRFWDESLDAIKALN
jgi:Transposase IS66 family